MALILKHSVLIVEDDMLLCQQMALALREIDCDVRQCHTAEEGLTIALETSFDLILLDVMLPGGMGGWELCQQLRKQMSTPIIFITALATTENIVFGLSIGADDYLTKPFNPVEFKARIAAHLRRHGGQTLHKLVFNGGEVEIDLKKHLILIDGEPINLTVREFELLEVLATHAGQVIRTRDLITRAWGEEFLGSKQNIKPYIHYLRKKIETDPASPRWINTVRGVGYRFGP